MLRVVYLLGTTAYAGVHSVIHLYDRETFYRSRRRQMLVTDKMALGLMLTVGGFALWPSMLHHDLNGIERFARGMDRPEKHPFIGFDARDVH